MHVGVILQRPAPGVQDAEEAEPIGADELRVGRQRECLAGRLEERGVDRPLMAPRDVAQRGRQREGDQEVGTRQQAVGLVLEPGLGLVALARRAMPVAAGAAHGLDLAAGVAAVEHRAQLTGAAGGDGAGAPSCAPRASRPRTARDTPRRTAAPRRRRWAWLRAPSAPRSGRTPARGSPT